MPQPQYYSGSSEDSARAVIFGLRKKQLLRLRKGLDKTQRGDSNSCALAVALDGKVSGQSSFESAYTRDTSDYADWRVVSAVGGFISWFDTNLLKETRPRIRQWIREALQSAQD